MASENPRDCALRSPPTPAEQDARTEQAVLGFLLSEHPAHLATSEVLRALIPGRQSFPATDAVERAIRELDGAGLLSRHDEFVAPTRAVLYLARLWEL